MQRRKMSATPFFNTLSALSMLLFAASAQGAELHVAAAANLSNVMPELAAAFEHKSGIRIVPSFGATAQLTQQIENGAPFDVFLSADTQHADQLVKDGFAPSDSRIVYARGRLVVWAPSHPEIRSLNDLTAAGVVHVAIATPALAPYGEAAVESLQKAGLWDKVQPKAVYASSIAISKQYADTGNVEAAFTAYALTAGQKGNQFTVDEKLHKPIDQAAVIVKESKEGKAAHSFMQFLASPDARTIFRRFGYMEP
jgi:molybdate transport system substrate-binding protein